MKPANWSRRLGAGALVAAGTASSMLMLSAVAPAGAAASPHPGKVAVSQGLDPTALKGHSVFPVGGGTKESVSFVLKERNLSWLESRVEAGMPGGYLKVGAFANRYGQSRSNVAKLEKYLKGFGIKTTAYGDRLNVAARGTAREFNKALSVTQNEYQTTAIPARGDQAARPAVTFHGTTDQPLLPTSIGSFVYAILGLTDYPVASSDAVHTPMPESKSAPASVQKGNRTPASFAKQYNLTGLYAKGAKGQGETIGIITYASVRPSDATHFWKTTIKIKTKANRIKLDNVDGGSGKVSNASGSGETTLDLEQSGALAPDANIIVYQAPNTDYGSADAWFGAASSNKASSISTSWGESEILNEGIGDNGTEAATYNGIFDEVGLEMAAQGQSAFDASGDSGAYDDIEDANPANGKATPYTELSVDNPADSPWVTAAGGTTNAGTIPLYDENGDEAATVKISAQRAWGWDYLYPYYYLFPKPTSKTGAVYSSEPPFVESTYYAAGGGGGYSTIEARPAYQSAIASISDFSAVPYETPTHDVDYPGTTLSLPTKWVAWPGASSIPATPPAVSQGTDNTGRVVPDLVADADPFTGYQLYFTGFPRGEHLQWGWGGTSFVAPQLNGSTAVIDSYLHHRSGFWNPAIYKFAVKSYTPFTPLDASSANNDNLYYTGTAGAKYNPGTGLGVPNLNKLALDFKYHG